MNRNNECWILEPKFDFDVILEMFERTISGRLRWNFWWGFTLQPATMKTALNQHRWYEEMSELLSTNSFSHKK